MNRAEATEWAVVLTEFISIYHAIHALTMAEINAFGKRSKVLGDAKAIFINFQRANFRFERGPRDA
jgi:hypothetical protein